MEILSATTEITSTEDPKLQPRLAVGDYASQRFDLYSQSIGRTGSKIVIFCSRRTTTICRPHQPSAWPSALMLRFTKQLPKEVAELVIWKPERRSLASGPRCSEKHRLRCVQRK